MKEIILMDIVNFSINSKAPKPRFFYVQGFCKLQKKTLLILAIKKQSNMPIAVGNKKPIAVHFKLCVSFFIVKSVVEQGQCIRKNSRVHRALIGVQPLLISSALISAVSCRVTICPVDIYAIIIIGSTISLAGNPKINAISIMPSRPMASAKDLENLQNK